MKRLLVIITLMISLGVSAQNPTTYFMEGSTMRSQWNPAFAPKQGYFNIPILGSIQADIQGNIALDNILYLNGGELATILDSSVSASEALSNLEKINRMGAGVNLGLLGFGSYTKNQKHFWSFDVNIRINTDARVPYEFFDFMKQGTSGDFANLGVSADAYVEAGFTYSFPIIDKLNVGVRGKFLVGAARASLNFSQFDAYMGADRWYAHAVGDLEISGVMPETKRTDDGTLVYDLDDFGDAINIPAGYGFGVDIGATYDLLPNLQLSLSVCDLGLMAWSKDGTAMGRVEEGIEFEGVEVDASGNVTRPSFDIDDLNFAVSGTSGVTKSLKTSINAGAEYNFFDRKIGLGLFYRAKFWEFKTQHNITASANFRPLGWLHLSGSYSFLNNRGHSMGFALNLCPGFINLFVGTDILLCKKTPQWIPISQSNMNVTFGLAVPMGKKGLRNVKIEE